MSTKAITLHQRPSEQLLALYGSDLSPVDAYLNGLEKNGNTYKTVVSVLTRVAKLSKVNHYNEIDWIHIAGDNLNNIIQTLRDQKKSPATINLYISIIRGVMRQLAIKHQISFQQYNEIKAVKSVKYHRELSGRALKETEIEKLLAWCIKKDDDIGWRDATMIALLFGCGLRRSEVVKMQTSNVSYQNEELKFIGKGNKERIVPIPKQVIQLLQHYMDRRGDKIGFLFYRYGRQKNDKKQFVPILTSAGQPAGLSSNMVYNIMKRRAMQAKIKTFAPHDLRRSFITTLLNIGISINIVSYLAGHASITTTQIYNMDKYEQGKKAMEKMDFKIPFPES